MELILIRHATTAWNRERRFAGTTDLPIAPEGEALAREVAKALPPVEHIYRSPLQRCAQTAALLWPKVPETVIDGLHETGFGIFEGKTHGELQDDPLYQEWLASGRSFAPPGGESLDEVDARVTLALRELLADAAGRGLRLAAVVTHGGVLMSLLYRYGSPQSEDPYAWRCGNCGGFRVLVQTEPLALALRSRL